MNKMIILLIFIIFIVSAGSLAYIYKTTSLLSNVNNQIITKNSVIDDLTKKLEIYNNKNTDYEKIKSDLDIYKDKKSELENKLDSEKKNLEKTLNDLDSCKKRKSETTNANVDDVFNIAFGPNNDIIKNNKPILENYKYLGCYKSNNDTFNKNVIGKDLTINSCSKLANSKNYKYFSYKGTKINTDGIKFDFENNKMDTNPFALGECYGENEIDLSKQSSTDKCVGQLINNYISYYDMFNNQIINNISNNSLNNTYTIKIGSPPLGVKDTISVYQKI
jgi:hypothetical protein